jgi:endonuclease I
MNLLSTIKTLITFLVLLGITSSTVFGQTPPSNLNGADLRVWLKANFYDGQHTSLGYSDARRKMYNHIDNKNNEITGVYGGYVQSWQAGGTGTNPAPINCEHVVPQSSFGKSEPMRSDIHHLFPTYGTWNSVRSNHPFGDIPDQNTTKWMIDTNQSTSIPSSNINSYSEYANSVFEPREDIKGNVARAVFYFYTMYPAEIGNMANVGDINLLYQWHLADPVDAAEVARNTAIVSFQGSHNPYVEQPDLLARAWGFSTGGGGGTPTTPTYCESKSTNAAGGWIGGITIGTFSNTSTGNVYTDNTATTIDVNTGNTAITLTPAFSGSSYNEYWKIWIDLNEDGDFEDADELVYDAGAVSKVAQSGTIVIPASADGVTTRMRVSMKYNGAPTSCETFTYGEVEDYTVAIGTSSGTTPAPAPSSYCSSKGASVADEYISRVRVGTIDNSSGSSNGYTDFTSLTTQMTVGSPYTITINPTWTGVVYNEGYAVWIDFNRDGDFSDANERVYSRSATNSTGVTGSFTIPNGVSLGYTRMRVSMKYNGIPTECENFSYGEVEDYIVELQAGGNARIETNEPSRTNIESVAQLDVSVYPNPAKDKLTVRIDANSADYRILDMSGKILKQGAIQSQELNVNLTNFQQGLYILLINNGEQVITKKFIKQ